MARWERAPHSPRHWLSLVSFSFPSVSFFVLEKSQHTNKTPSGDLLDHDFFPPEAAPPPIAQLEGPGQQLLQFPRRTSRPRRGAASGSACGRPAVWVVDFTCPHGRCARLRRVATTLSSRISVTVSFSTSLGCPSRTQSSPCHSYDGGRTVCSEPTTAAMMLANAARALVPSTLDRGPERARCHRGERGADDLGEQKVRPLRLRLLVAWSSAGHRNDSGCSGSALCSCPSCVYSGIMTVSESRPGARQR